MSVRGALLALLLAAEPQDPSRDFPAYLWRLEHQGRPLPERLLDLGLGANVERAEDAAWLVERDAPFYVGHAPGRNALHLDRDRLEVALERSAFTASRDVRASVRVPCLSDPDTLAGLLEQLEQSVSAPHRDRADFISLGDEVSITPWGDPAETCRHPACDRAFERWVVAGGGARYGVAPGAVRPATDALLSSPSPDRFGAWLAARAFQRQVLTDVLVSLAQRSRELRPEVPVGLLGAIGETAFGGVDLEGLGPHVQVLEPYRVADAVERCATLRALGRGPTTVLRTVFLDQLDPPGLAAELEGLLDAPVDGVVLWSDRVLAASDALTGALATGLERLRSDRGARPHRDRDPRGVAVIHSDDSLAHAFLREARGDRLSWIERLAGHQERHGSHESRRRELFDELRSNGANPGAVAIELVGSDLVERFPRLITLDLTVVSDGELAQLEVYRAAGGTLEHRGPFASHRPDGSAR